MSEHHTPEQRFWDWFEANSTPYRSFTPEDDNLEEIFDRLHLELDKVAPGIVFEFSSAIESDREFILSADGIVDVFPAVEALVQAAPSLPGWQIIAFRQRGDASASIGINDLTLAPEQIYFTLARDGGLIGISLFIAEHHRFTSHQLGVASFLLLDNAIGEYDVVRKVSFINRQPLPNHPLDTALKPLNELPAAFDALYAEMWN